MLIKRGFYKFPLMQTHKLLIWIIDDISDHRDDINAKLIPSENNYAKKTKIKLINTLFDVKQFSSARKAEDELKNLADRQGREPDFVLSDNNFVHLKDIQDKNDKAADRGLQLLEYISREHPSICFGLVTNHSTNTYTTRFFKTVSQQNGLLAAATAFLFAQQKDKLNGNHLSDILKEITKRKLEQITLNSIELLRTKLDTNTKLETLLATEIKCGDYQYQLKYLVAPFAQIDKHPQTNQPITVFDFEEIQAYLNQLIPQNRPQLIPQNRPQIFTGQLRAYSQFNHNNEITNLQRRMVETIRNNQEEIIKQQMNKVERSICAICANQALKQIIFAAHPSPTQLEHLANINLENSFEIKSLSPNDLGINQATFNDTWNNIIYARCMLITMNALSQRFPFDNRPLLLKYSFAFTIHVLIRHNVNDLIQQLQYDQVIDMPNRRGASKHNNLRKYINTSLGLSISTFAATYFDPHLVITEEQINFDSLYPSDQLLHNNIRNNIQLTDIHLD